MGDISAAARPTKVTLPAPIPTGRKWIERFGNAGGRSWIALGPRLKCECLELAQLGLAVMSALSPLLGDERT